MPVHVTCCKLRVSVADLIQERNVEVSNLQRSLEAATDAAATLQAEAEDLRARVTLLANADIELQALTEDHEEMMKELAQLKQDYKVTSKHSCAQPNDM